MVFFDKFMYPVLNIAPTFLQEDDACSDNIIILKLYVTFSFGSFQTASLLMNETAVLVLHFPLSGCGPSILCGVLQCPITSNVIQLMFRKHIHAYFTHPNHQEY